MATKGIVKGIVSNLVSIEVDGPVSQNEICYISVGGVRSGSYTHLRAHETAPYIVSRLLLAR